MGDLYAEKAIRLIGKNLKCAVTDPDNLAARSGMALGATLAGAAFSSCGVSLVNALQFSLNAKFKCKHGVANAMVLPEVMKFWSTNRQARLAEIAAYLGVDEARGLQPADAAIAAIEWVRDARQQIGIPESLSVLGATKADVAEVAGTAILQDQLIELSPVTPHVDDLLKILEASF